MPNKNKKNDFINKNIYQNLSSLPIPEDVEKFKKLVDLNYKGFSGSIEYDSKGMIYTGEVERISPVITFNGISKDEVEKSFKNSIDIYLSLLIEDNSLFRLQELKYFGFQCQK